MTIYSRYEEVEIICTSDDMHADVAGMMREAKHEVEAHTLRGSETIVAVEPWGVESRVVPRVRRKTRDTAFVRRDVYSYRVTIDQGSAPDSLRPHQ